MINDRTKWVEGVGSGEWRNRMPHIAIKTCGTPPKRLYRDAPRHSNLAAGEFCIRRPTSHRKDSAAPRWKVVVEAYV